MFLKSFFLNLLFTAKLDENLFKKMSSPKYSNIGEIFKKYDKQDVEDQIFNCPNVNAVILGSS
jgi:hypothetical protein